jgi:RHS repeat-associated protein
LRKLSSGNALADFVHCGPRRVEKRIYYEDASGSPIVSTCDYTYNGGQDLIGIDCKDALGVRQVGFAHVIDKAGNKLHEVKLHDLSRSHAYLHDGLHRLVSYTEGAPDQNDPNIIPAPTRQQTWNLDKLGNWKTFTETTGGLTTTQDRSHNKVNELRTITVGGVEKNLKYDAAGNLKDDTVFHYRYDEEQRLKAVFTSVVDPITGNRVAGIAIARYKYDALGRRILKRLLNPDGSTLLVTRFYYDGDRVVEERTGAQNLPSRQYIWGNYVDELLVNDTVDAFGNVVPAARLYALQNSTYSVHALVNDAGTVVERYDYTPYGEVTFLSPGGVPLPDPVTGLPRTSSAVGNVYLFTGQQFDSETGLRHFDARAYSAKFGRFLQRDPVDDELGVNLYEYVASRPTVATDPTGEELVFEPDRWSKRWLEQWAKLQEAVKWVGAPLAPYGIELGAYWLPERHTPAPMGRGSGTWLPSRDLIAPKSWNGRTIPSHFLDIQRAAARAAGDKDLDAALWSLTNPGSHAGADSKIVASSTSAGGFAVYGTELTSAERQRLNKIAGFERINPRSLPPRRDIVGEITWLIVRKGLAVARIAGGAVLIVASLPPAATPIGWAGLAFGGDEVITGILNAANWGTNEIPSGTQMLLRVFVENETAAFWIELVLKGGTGVGVKLLSRKIVPVRGPVPEPGAGEGGRVLWGAWADYAKVTVSGVEYAKIGTRLYTRHAVERMLPSGLGAPAGALGAGRSVPPAFVEHAIATGTTTTQVVGGVTRTVYTSGTLHVVTEDGGRIVVTIITGAL